MNTNPASASGVDFLALAESNQARADAVIADAGIYAAWQFIGAEVHPVGSCSMGLLMKHRDIDFHIYTDELDPAASFRALGMMARDSRFRRLVFTNLADTSESCLEFHAWFADSVQDADGEWQIDMIQILRGSAYDGFFEHIAERIRAVLTPELRRTILYLKFLAPESEHIMGIEFYRAVIAGGVRSWPEFTAWRAANPVDGILTWCP